MRLATSSRCERTKGKISIFLNICVFERELFARSSENCEPQFRPRSNGQISMLPRVHCDCFEVENLAEAIVMHQQKEEIVYFVSTRGCVGI